MQAFSYEENKIKLHDVGHMTKMAAMPIYVMNLSKYSPEPLDRFARNFVCSIYSAFAGSGSLLLMRGFQIFAKRK